MEHATAFYKGSCEVESVYTVGVGGGGGDIWAFLLCCDSLFCSLYQVVLVAMPTFMLNWEFGSLFSPCFVTSIKRSRRADSQHATSCQKSPSFELGIILQWSDSTNHRTNMPTKLTYQVVYSWKLNLSPPSVSNQFGAFMSRIEFHKFAGPISCSFRDRYVPFITHIFIGKILFP